MKTVTFEVCPTRQAMENIVRDTEAGIPDTSARMVFSSKEVLAQIMSEARWNILKKLCGAGVMQVDALAVGLNRNVDGVEADIVALLKAGVLDADGKKGVLFPYDQIVLDLPSTGRSTV